LPPSAAIAVLTVYKHLGFATPGVGGKVEAGGRNLPVGGCHRTVICGFGAMAPPRSIP